jgi:hypothetical protein
MFTLFQSAGSFCTMLQSWFNFFPWRFCVHAVWCIPSQIANGLHAIPHTFEKSHTRRMITRVLILDHARERRTAQQ